MVSRQLLLLCLISLPLLFAGCSKSRYSQKHDSAPKGEDIDFAAIADATPKAEPLSRYGNPLTYVVRGKRYYRLTSSEGYSEQGLASWYGTKFHGHRTSSGEPFDMYAMTAAHKTLPLPTYARVTNLNNGRTVIVKINDRGPFHDDRIIDLSYAAAGKLGILSNGTGRVEVIALSSNATPAEKHQHHLVQVGAFQTRSNAIALKRKLIRTINHETHIISASTDHGLIFRVRIGPFSSEEAARSLNQQLISDGIADSIVITDTINTSEDRFH
ncbi:MAG: septal ring lytic transglycosylase RlpA family protein [Candidatus Polarisedimenticolaceae bacterium]|nr:septal ring lytic transglycosylase RlpA family protein [Candidatus Polarisedimenticolaceae bacterium]